jgi:hypothetical protein
LRHSYHQLARFTAFATGLFTLTLISGCGTDSQTIGGAPPVSPAAVQGHVFGGQQPVVNAQIFLYAAGVNTPGAGPTNLLGTTSILTDAGGGFSFPGNVQCPAQTSQIYLLARGGNPGLTPAVDNAALVMMTALGDCDNLTSLPFLEINEVTTAAAAWSLSQFLGPGAAVTSSATNAVGLRNAFLTAQTLVNPTNGTSPGATLPTGAVLESPKIYSLANVLAPCVNSDGTAGCAALFSAALNGANPPTNTLDAALNIVRNPAAQVQPVFQVAAPKSPFQPALGAAPNDWTLSVTFSGGGLNQPGDLAIDSAGNIWAPNYFGSVVSEFSPTGTPIDANGIAGNGLYQSFGIAIDSSNDVWVSNENSVGDANNGYIGSVSKFSNAGTELSGYGYVGGGLYYPQGVAADSNGKIWVADYGSSSATYLSNSGSAISGNSGYGHAELPFTSAVAIDANHNAWFAAQQSAVMVTPTGVVTRHTCCDDPEGIAVDQSGYIWLADYGGARVIKINSSGNVEASVESPDGMAAAQGIAIDGAGNVFTANFRGDSIEELSSNATVLSPISGFGLDAPLNEPLGIALDASGNLWVSNTGANTLTQFVGLATPVHTPMAGPPTSP